MEKREVDTRKVPEKRSLAYRTANLRLTPRVNERKEKRKYPSAWKRKMGGNRSSRRKMTPERGTYADSPRTRAIK